MTIQDLGSIGELIAAVATVGTLIYLAFQIRASTAASRAESVRTVAQTSASYMTSIIESPDVARVFLAGLTRDSDISPEDGVRFDFLMAQIVSLESAAFEEARLGVGDAARLDERATAVTAFLVTPGGRRWWNHYADQYGPEFRQSYQSRIDVAERAAQQSAAADSAQA